MNMIRTSVPAGRSVFDDSSYFSGSELTMENTTLILQEKSCMFALFFPLKRAACSKKRAVLSCDVEEGANQERGTCRVFSSRAALGPLPWASSSVARFENMPSRWPKGER